MSLEINYIGRLGNNILQYLMGQYLSHKFNLQFNAELESNDDFIIHKTSGSKNYSCKVEVNDSNIFDIINTENIKHGIHLNGYFHDRKIFENKHIINFYKSRIIFKPLNGVYDLFAHVRLGDIDNRHNLPYEYYHEQIEKVPYEKCTISTDSPDHDIVKKLMSNFKNCNILGDCSPSYALRYGANCNNLVLSPGTFSFCIAFFSLCDPDVYCIDNIILKEKFNRKSWDGGVFTAFIGREKFNFYNRSLSEAIIK
jgi:hypothetical protein